MAAKTWRNIRMTYRGRAQKARFSQEAIDGLIQPFLERLTRLYHEKGRRIVALLAAPPGTGKSTLALFLQNLSLCNEDLAPVQALMLDGFHYHSDYIATHTVMRDGEEIPMKRVKGCPESYDVDKFLQKLAAVREEDIRWPIYDRSRHDVIDDLVPVTKPIVLIEGNWVLLGEEKWREAREYADYTLMITATMEQLRERLINRKMEGGLSRKAAEDFFEDSDRRNIERVLKKSWPADETWVMQPDGDFAKKIPPQPLRGRERAALWKQADVEMDDPYFLRMMNERIAKIPNDGSYESAFSQGFLGGFEKARGDIIRKLHEKGMPKDELKETFSLQDDTLDALLKNLPAPPPLPKTKEMRAYSDHSVRRDDGEMKGIERLV